MSDATTILILGAVVLAAWLWLRRRGSTARQAEARLRRICMGDDARVERLIDSEQARAPGISRADAANRAAGRYQRDNH